MMIRSLTAILLLIAFAVQTFQQDLIVAGYWFNRSLYIKNCENKAKPSMHCNGKCQMMKKLKQEEKKDQENPQRKLENRNTLYSLRSYSASFSSLFTAERQSFHFPYSTGHPVNISFSVFHPPGLT